MDTNEKPASQQIDDIIHNAVGWKGETLARLRGVINSAGAGIAEEVKWKKPSKPEGVAVWSHNGNICVADVLKNAVRLTFPKGAQLNDPTAMFNTRLDSKTVRAVDFFENTSVDEPALKRVVIE
ncbi:MAG TPA: DUF1801 domain-containing protein, partial [Candidatus Saccharimonadales bacterium]|nr:DUF1801 domain-containing protein [Candidatus Saccharimonadales bacterium]